MGDPLENYSKAHQSKALDALASDLYGPQSSSLSDCASTKRYFVRNGLFCRFEQVSPEYGKHFLESIDGKRNGTAVLVFDR